jgi:hypothetical protein
MQVPGLKQRSGSAEEPRARSEPGLLQAKNRAGHIARIIPGQEMAEPSLPGDRAVSLIFFFNQSRMPCGSLIHMNGVKSGMGLPTQR